MSTTTVRTTMTVAEVERFLANLPAMIAGTIPDPTGIVREAQLGFAFDLFVEIKLAYITKARGGTDRAGIDWAPLSPSTIARRRLRGIGGVEILRDTGRLLNSLSPAAPGVVPPDGVMEVGPGFVRVGTNVVYARYHQDGGNVPGRPPQRKIVWDADEVPRDILAKIVGKFRDRILRLVQRRVAS